MNIIVIITALLAVLTKYLDCLTTSTRIRSVNFERNPLARKLMNLFGIQNTIWVIFVLEFVIIGAFITPVINSNSIYEKSSFIVIMIIISIVQGLVAWNNSKHDKLK